MVNMVLREFVGNRAVSPKFFDRSAVKHGLKEIFVNAGRILTCGSDAPYGSDTLQICTCLCKRIHRYEFAVFFRFDEFVREGLRPCSCPVSEYAVFVRIELISAGSGAVIYDILVYVSLLKDVPVDMLKLDMKFIESEGREGRGRGIAE